MDKYTKAVLVVTAICLSNTVFADGQYQKEKNCIAAFSLARDIASNAGETKRLKELTAAQNEIYLSRPSGYFKPKHIDTMKFLYKQRIQKNGLSALTTELNNCGWKENG